MKTVNPPRAEEYTVSADNLLDKIKELAHEGNVRRILIRDENGHELLEIPLTVGVVGALLVPVWAAVAAVAVFASHFTVAVTREPAQETK